MFGDVVMFPMTHKILFVELIGSCLKTIKIGEIGLILKEAWTSQRHNYLQKYLSHVQFYPNSIQH